jgi:hypothetical protein
MNASSEPRNLVEDATHVALGLGILAVQQCQIRRRELDDRLRRLVEEPRFGAPVDDLLAQVVPVARAALRTVERLTEELLAGATGSAGSSTSSAKG